MKRDKFTDLDRVRLERFRTKLQKRLKTLHMSQRHLSELTGVSQGDISHLIHGKFNPSFLTVLKLADGLDVSIDYFLKD